MHFSRKKKYSPLHEHWILCILFYSITINKNTSRKIASAIFWWQPLLNVIYSIWTTYVACHCRTCQSKIHFCSSWKNTGTCTRAMKELISSAWLYSIVYVVLSCAKNSPFTSSQHIAVWRVVSLYSRSAILGTWHRHTTKYKSGLWLQQNAGE